MLAEHDPKSMAKRLRAALGARDITISHSTALELVANQLGYNDWNTAAAKLAPPDLILPKDWKLSGDDPKGYDVGIDPKNPKAGATIRAREAEGKQAGFATLMQSIDGQNKRGQRLRLRADLRCVNVVGAATIWLRMDGASKGGIMFDNMERRSADGPLRGTEDWQTRDIVLDVPKETQSIHYGFYLRGSGQCWARDFDLSEVPDTVPVTSIGGQFLDAPSNLAMQ